MSSPRVESRFAPASGGCERLVLVLIRPTRYDDDGYVVRHWRGTLPSNTLSCLNALTEDAIRSGALGDVQVEVHVFDEAVDRVRPDRLARRLRRPGTYGLVALAGVQTNQFPRACDLARAFIRRGFAAMIGGFHVSGSAALAPELPPECRAAVSEGITLVLGEVEEQWAGLLRDAVRGQLRPVYDFLAEAPSLDARPLPRTSPRLQRRFAVRDYATIDAGRGCPFNCSFCTVINVQGRTMRSRSAADIIERVREGFRARKDERITHYFFTDDNFARNPQWEPIFDGLIALRRDEGVAVDFMMQVDIAAARIPRFVEKAAAAGCVQVFIGMESLHEDNLRAAGKRQNRVDQYRASIGRWHEAGIVCHVGFIIGFPYDTRERVIADVRMLRDELLVDQASFFMLTPLPGSRDHRDAVAAGARMDPDYNNFDSFHATTDHPRMSAEEWTTAYRDAWREFYSFDQMRQALLRQNPHTYWGLFKCFLWYRAAMVEGSHPMVTGFVRRKARLDRRPGLPVETRWAFARRRARDIAGMIRGYAALLLEMQELWLRTRIRPEEYAVIGDLRRLRRQMGNAIVDVKRHWARAHAALAAAAEDGRLTGRLTASLRERIEAMCRALAAVRPATPPPEADVVALDDLREPALSGSGRRSWIARALRRANPLAPPRSPSRLSRAEYWRQTRQRIRGLRFWQINPFAVIWNAARDARGLAAFLRSMASERF